jgi:hypothetical protein
MTGIDTAGIMDLIRSQALATGRFASVNGHEPKSAPQVGSAITYAFWVDSIEPVESSGLASVSARLTIMGRVYASMFTEPADTIDPAIVDAASALIALYCTDLDLNGRGRSVDVFGMEGTKVSAKAGYLEQDKKVFRVMDITLPIIINDVWDESV